MPRQQAIHVENQFVRGLITEATGLNFPENACTETDNCVFNQIGEVTRRLGIDLEANYVHEAINRTGSVITSFLWNNVAGEGSRVFVVLQVGTILRFYVVGAANSLSGGLHDDTIDITAYLAPNAPSSGTIECQFASGNGLLFVTHPYLEAFRVSYDPTGDTITGTQIDLEIRDLEGLDDNLAPQTRPSSLSVAHQYNLMNQGWTLKHINTFNTFSVSRNGTTTSGQPTLTGLSQTSDLYEGMRVSGTNIPASTTVISVDSPTQVTMSANATGSGTSSKTFMTEGYPSNADVWWYYKNSSEQFDISTVANVVLGNTEAAKGHFILNLYDQDREAVSGVTGAQGFSTGFQRCATCTFFAGRLFYSGLAVEDYNSRIFFSQIIETPEQYGRCYQLNDPTSEVQFDLLPTDGGVIKILDAGRIIKMIPVFGQLLVFASNGIWAISGSEGLGFSAVDYTISKVSSTRVLSHSNFVDVNGMPVWWSADGIYTLEFQAAAATPTVKSLTDNTIKDFYDTISIQSKIDAKGVFNPITRVIQWVFRSEFGNTLLDKYNYDSILNLNTLTGAFYPWSINTDAADTTLNGLVVIEAFGGNLVTFNVQSDADDVQSDGDDVVIIKSENPSATPLFKYLLSTPDGADYNFAFGEEKDTTFKDFVIADGNSGIDYESYFTTGFKIRGDAQRKFQSNYVHVFTKNFRENQYKFQGKFDYAIASNTGRWSTNNVNIPAGDYDVIKRKLKVRGHGIACQYKISSVSGKAFDVIGWSAYDTVNQLP